MIFKSLTLWILYKSFAIFIRVSLKTKFERYVLQAFDHVRWPLTG